MLNLVNGMLLMHKSHVRSMAELDFSLELMVVSGLVYCKMNESMLSDQTISTQKLNPSRFLYNLGPKCWSSSFMLIIIETPLQIESCF